VAGSFMRRFDSLRRFDVQARYAAAMALGSILPMVAAVTIVMRNYNGDLRQIVYRQNTYVVALLACLGVSAFLGIVASILGFNSADQRVNDKPKLSWLGFFLGVGVVTLDVLILVAFVMLRLQQPG